MFCPIFSFTFLVVENGGLPAWVSEQIKIGVSLSDCLEMVSLLNEKDKEKRVERDERNAEREMKKATLEHEHKIRE